MYLYCIYMIVIPDPCLKKPTLLSISNENQWHRFLIWEVDQIVSSFPQFLAGSGLQWTEGASSSLLSGFWQPSASLCILFTNNLPWFRKVAFQRTFMFSEGISSISLQKCIILFLLWRSTLINKQSSSFISSAAGWTTPLVLNVAPNRNRRLCTKKREPISTQLLPWTKKCAWTICCLL